MAAGAVALAADVDDVATVEKPVSRRCRWRWSDRARSLRCRCRPPSCSYEAAALATSVPLRRSCTALTAGAPGVSSAAAMTSSCRISRQRSNPWFEVSHRRGVLVAASDAEKQEPGFSANRPPNPVRPVLDGHRLHVVEQPRRRDAREAENADSSPSITTDIVIHYLVRGDALDGWSQGHRDGVLISLKTSAGVRCSW